MHCESAESNRERQGRNRVGRATATRPLKDIDHKVKLNKELWVLAEEMRRLKA